MFFSFFWLFRAGVPIYKARKSSKRGKPFCQENSESKWVRSRVFQSNRSFARKYAENEHFPQVVDIHSLNLRRAIFTSLKVAVRVAICGILVRNIRHITPQFASFDMLRDHLWPRYRISLTTSGTISDVANAYSAHCPRSKTAKKLNLILSR